MRVSETTTDEMEATLPVKTRATAPARKLLEIEALRSAARWLNGIGLACVAVALLCAVVGFVTVISEGRSAAGSYRAAGGFLVAAFMLVVVGQLTHIRAALEERNKRP